MVAQVAGEGSVDDEETVEGDGDRDALFHFDIVIVCIFISMKEALFKQYVTIKYVHRILFCRERVYIQIDVREV